MVVVLDWNPFIEALPRFSILNLDKQVRRGAQDIVWCDQGGELVGSAYAIRLEDHRLDFSYAFGEERRGYVTGGWGDVSLILNREKRGEMLNRPSVLCPDCKKPKEVILFMDHAWSCSACHDVFHLRRSLDAETRRYMNFVELGRIAEHPRPKSMRHETYDRKVREYQRMSQYWLARAPRTLTADRLCRVDAVYSRNGARL